MLCLSRPCSSVAIRVSAIPLPFQTLPRVTPPWLFCAFLHFSVAILSSVLLCRGVSYLFYAYPLLRFSLHRFAVAKPALPIYCALLAITSITERATRNQLPCCTFNRIPVRFFSVPRPSFLGIDILVARPTDTIARCKMW